VLKNNHLHIQKTLNIVEELQSLFPVQGVDTGRTPLDGRLFPVKQTRVVRELETYVRFTKGVPARPWGNGVVPNIRISEREI
jgi:hypothetical protein